MVHQGDCVSGTSSHSVDGVNLWLFQYSLWKRFMFQFYQQVPNITRIFFINNSNDVPIFFHPTKNLVSISHLLQGQGAIKDPILLDLCVLKPFIVKVHKKGVWVQYISTKRSTNHNISTGNVFFFKGLHNQTSGILSEFRTYFSTTKHLKRTLQRFVGHKEVMRSCTTWELKWNLNAQSATAESQVLCETWNKGISSA